MDREKVLAQCEWAIKQPSPTIIEAKKFYEEVLALLKEQESEYEKGFNDAMLGKQELMYEGADGKWHKKDW